MRKTCDEIINLATVEIREQMRKLLERQEKLREDILEKIPGGHVWYKMDGHI